MTKKQDEQQQYENEKQQAQEYTEEQVDEQEQTEPASRNGDADEQQQQIADLQQLLEEERNKHLQARADLQNYRNRVEEEKSKYGLQANMLLVNSLLEILDDLQMALNDQDMDLARAKEVMQMFNDKTIAALDTAGVEKIEVNAGDKFDSSYMEAITTVPVEDSEQDGQVVDVVSNAFKYKNKQEILKTAKVIVGKTQEKQAE